MSTQTIIKTKIRHNEEIHKVHLTPASEYFKHLPKMKKEISLEEVRKRLSKIKGSLSEEIVRTRNMERP